MPAGHNPDTSTLGNLYKSVPMQQDRDIDGEHPDVPLLPARPALFSAYIHRCLTHCAFFTLCCSYLVISSLPRITAFIDFPLSAVVYAVVLRPDSMPFLEYSVHDVVHYQISESGCDIVFLSLGRSILLFEFFAYRNQTKSSALIISRLSVIFSLAMLFAKLYIASSRIHPLTVVSIAIVVSQFLAFTLARRRRILAPRQESTVRYAVLPKEDTLIHVDTVLDSASQLLLEPDSRFLNFEGLSIHYRYHQHPTSPHSICLLHGFGGGVFSWRQVWPQLTEFCSVLAFDRPGFGLSCRPFGQEVLSRELSPYSPEFSIKVSNHLLDTFNMKEALIVGHSTGASLAMMLAKRVPPLSALCIVSFTEMTTLPSFVRSMFMTRLGRSVIMQLVRSELGQVSMRRSWYNPSCISEEIIDDYRSSMLLPNWSEAIVEMVNVSEQHHCIEKYASIITCPVTIIQGVEDKLCSLGELQRLATTLHGRSRLIRIHECGHIPQQEAPEAFIDAIRSCLPSQSPEPSLYIK